MKPISSAPLDANFRYRIGNDAVAIDSVFGNPQLLLGFDAQAFLAGTVDLRARIHADDADIAAQLFAPQATPQRQVVNLRLRQANGRVRCVKCSYEKLVTAAGVTLDLLLEDAKSLPRTLDDAAAMLNFRAMMENTDDFIFFKDRNHVFTGASQTLVALCDPAEHWTDLIGQTDYDVFPEEFADAYYKLEKQVYAGGEVAHEVQEYLSKEGCKGWVDNRKYPIRNAAGEIIGLYGIARDITGIKQAEAEVLQQSEILQLILDYAPIGIWLQDGNGKIAFVNKAFCQAAGIPEERFLSVDHYVELIPEEFRSQCLASDAKALASAGVSVTHQRLPFVDGQIHDLRIIKAVKRDAEQRPVALVGLSLDITEEIRQERALLQERDSTRNILATVEAMIVALDTEGRITLVNRKACEILGYREDDLIGQDWFATCLPRSIDVDQVREVFKMALAGNLAGSEYYENPVRTRSDEERLIAWHNSTIRDKDGNIIGGLSAGEDITERKLAEEEINRLAFFDQLTGLPNRTLLQDRLKQAIASSHRSGRYGALLLLDLDYFKTLNDTLGHDMGDLLLKQVALRLSECIREEDTVARLGGDEFVVMLVSLSENQIEAASLIELIGEKIIAALNQTYELKDVAYRITPSIGASVFLGHQTDIDTLMKQADLAMYKAKEAGRNTLRFFDPDMAHDVLKRAILDNDLREAVQKKQFVLHYQAQMAGSQVIGVEVLLRWQHPERGLVFPGEFIPVIEETGLILPVGQWVLETACQQLAAWAIQPGMSYLTVAVNISAHQLNHKDFVDQVLRALELSGANPDRLKLELTESLLVNNVEEIIGKMIVLKAKGVGFSLDDFGTGYSSLAYLKRLPLDQLKIDQSFVRDILTDPNDAAIARMIVVLAETLGLAVIAEGVETEAQRDFLAQQGCRAYQGYLFSRPVPLDEFESYIKRV